MLPNFIFATNCLLQISVVFYMYFDNTILSLEGYRAYIKLIKMRGQLLLYLNLSYERFHENTFEKIIIHSGKIIMIINMQFLA